MQPRTKLQREIVRLSAKLPPLSDYQLSRAIKLFGFKIAKCHNQFNGSVLKKYTCIHCGHVWIGEPPTSGSVDCPNCKNHLTCDTTRRKNYLDKTYIGIITRAGGFQVIRTFMFEANGKAGEPAIYEAFECFQRWIAPTGKSVIMALSRNYSYYRDCWCRGSKMVLKSLAPLYSYIHPTIIGRQYITPQLQRNGYSGDLHDINPHVLLPLLITDSKIETLWKAGHYGLVSELTARYGNLDSIWPSLKIALRHGYAITDFSLWSDYIGLLDRNGEDIRNPKNLCPENLRQAHDQQHVRAMALIRRRQQQMEIERALKHEAEYQQAKQKFFDLCFTDNELTVTPLKSVAEFVREGQKHHHCVFSCGYFNKEDSLIFHAMVENESIATIEVNLRSMKILQCRGTNNLVPQFDERIRSLILQNRQQIAKCMTTSTIAS